MISLEPEPEQTIIPKHRPAPPYYIVGRHIAEIGDLTEGLPANIAAAMNYLWRCGKKPDADPLDDLLKAVDYLLREYWRQKKLRVVLNIQQDIV